tara:strand:+ start:92 stop:205 length:114 start_codon:yes stop_codon:yes gene_type:complete
MERRKLGKVIVTILSMALKQVKSITRNNIEDKVKGNG